MGMVYNTNALLSVARLPFHFWNILNPTEDSRDNPGTSIISYVVAKTLTFETTSLPSELTENMHRSMDFSNHRSKITDALKMRVSTVATVLTHYNGDDKYWQIAINGSLGLDRIKTKINEILVKMTMADENDFGINDELIQVKLELDNLKHVLNDEGILFEWENKK